MSEKRDTTRRKLLLSSVPCERLEIGAWLAALNDCRERTFKVIAKLRSEDLDQTSPLCRNTIGALLYHIAAIELDWLYSDILEAEFPDDFRSWFPCDVRDSADNLTIVTGDTVQRHKERLHYVREKLIMVLESMSFSEFQAVRRLKDYDLSTEWVVHHLLQHEAEHRGQITMLLRQFETS